MKPTHYTSTEGATWLPWHNGEVEPDDLAKRGRQFVMISGHVVHSLHDNTQRWDCINGMNNSAWVFWDTCNESA